jgi:hypothetical protein
MRMLTSRVRSAIEARPGQYFQYCDLKTHQTPRTQQTQKAAYGWPKKVCLLPDMPERFAERALGTDCLSGRFIVDDIRVVSGLCGSRRPEIDSFSFKFPAMTVSDQWTEVLRCPNCAATGVASLSQTSEGALAVNMLPAGFRAVSSKYGDTFFCAECERPATTSLT